MSNKTNKNVIIEADFSECKRYNVNYHPPTYITTAVPECSGSSLHRIWYHLLYAGIFCAVGLFPLHNMARSAIGLFAVGCVWEYFNNKFNIGINYVLEFSVILFIMGLVPPFLFYGIMALSVFMFFRK